MKKTLAVFAFLLLLSGCDNNPQIGCNIDSDYSVYNFPSKKILASTLVPTNLVSRVFIDGYYNSWTFDKVENIKSFPGCAISDADDGIKYIFSREVLNDEKKFGYIEYIPEKAMSPESQYHLYSQGVINGPDPRTIDTNPLYACDSISDLVAIFGEKLVTTSKIEDVVPPSAPIIRSVKAYCEQDICLTKHYLEFEMDPSSDPDTVQELINYDVFARIDATSLNYFSFLYKSTFEPEDDIYLSTFSVIEQLRECSDIKGKTVEVGLQAVDAGGNRSEMQTWTVTFK
jgi:hypothetical protein